MARARPALVAFAIVASLLVATAPAAAVSTNTALGSIHTTDADFNNATELTNVSVVGSGPSAQVEHNPTAQIFDDFEDGDISEYGGDTGSFSAVDESSAPVSARNGSRLLAGSWSDGTPQSISSVSGLDDYPSPGDSFNYWVRSDSSAASNSMYFATQSATSRPDSYSVLVHANIDELILREWSSGSPDDLVTTGVTIDADTWYRVRVDWQADGTITVTLFDESGAELASVTHQDQTYTSGGIGFEANGGGSSDGTTWFDFVSTPGTGPGTYVSQTHSVDGVETEIEGFTNLTLSNTEAHVTWLADTDDDGSFETEAASSTFTTTGNHSLDLSGTDSTDWRVNVTFVETGEDTVGELHDEGLLFQNHDPVAENATASPSGGENTNNEDVPLSIDVGDHEFDSAQGDTVDVEIYVNGSLIDTQQITSNQTISTTAGGLPNGTHTWHVELDDEYGGSGISQTFSFDVQHYAPTLDNASASPTGELTTREVTLSIPLEDRDFPEPSGDSVDVEFFVDGVSDGTETVTANGTVEHSTTITGGGSHTWNVTATDEYGLVTKSQEFSVQTPGNLSIRRETVPDEFVKNVQVNVTAYHSDEVVRRNTSNGNVSLAGLPIDEPITVRTNATGYYARTVVIESVFEQNDMYLLNESVPAYLIRYDLQDPTGNYPREDTVLLVERDLELNGSVEWRVIAGDNFGVQGVPIDLARNERYRLRIKNLESEDTNLIGAYTAIQSETVTITAGSATVDVTSSGRDYTFTAIENETGQYILIEYLDSAEQTVEIKVTVHERFNTSRVLVDNTTFSSTNDLMYQIPMTSDQANRTWMAELYIDRGDGFVHHRVPVGSGPRAILPSDLDAVWVEGIGVFVLLVVGMAFSELNQGVGAIVTSLVGGALWFFGILTGTATAAAIAIAIAISVVYHYQRGGVGV